MMLWTDRIRQWKWAMIVVALVISAVSLVVSRKLANDLFEEEVQKMKVWAEAMRSLTVADENTDLTLVLSVINSNHTIPVVVLDKDGSVLASRNLTPEPHGEDSVSVLQSAVTDMKENGECMTMDCTTKTSESKDFIRIYYKESTMLHRLTVYPYVQLLVVCVFGLVCVFFLLASKRAEQNHVWVGLSKETAHQLGTPISSLMAWSEVLKETYPDDPLLKEMDKDVQRLQLIAERFSKIGSAPELEKMDLRPVVKRVADYYDRRTSSKVLFSCDLPSEVVCVNMSAPLFEWVIENLCKNAVDAMQGKGSIRIEVGESEQKVYIDLSDTGKGIARKNFKTVFKPGFTTKKRGWGLGLSLAKRIVEVYHHGRIYVKCSEEGKGTTFRVELPRCCSA